MAGPQREDNGSMSIEALADRIRRALAGTRNLAERRMFGGIAFMIDGNLALSASPNGLLVRVGRESMAAALQRKGARPMQMGERVMTGYLFVDADGMRSERDFARWIDTALQEVRSLPRKANKRRQVADTTRRRRRA